MEKVYILLDSGVEWNVILKVSKNREELETLKNKYLDQNKAFLSFKQTYTKWLEDKNIEYYEATNQNLRQFTVETGIKKPRMPEYRITCFTLEDSYYGGQLHIEEYNV